MDATLADLSPFPRVTGVAVGVFDGVHRGHRAILDRILAESGPEASAAVTFEPHPLFVIAPAQAPPRLTAAAQRTALLQAAGIAEVVTLRFDDALRGLGAAEFLAGLHRLFPDLRRIAIGPNWRFGHGRQGDIATLEAYGRAHGFAAELTPALEYAGQPVSSSRIRQALLQRAFADAAAMLGREYEVGGVVVRGDGRGAGIGFPTANVGGISQLLPPPGVYACRATVGGAPWRGVANYGSKPTFGPDGKPVLEVHLLGFAGDLYDASIAVGAFRHLRDERKFPSVGALREQIARDVEAARAF